MFRIKQLILMFFLVFVSVSHAQIPSIIDCSTVLMVPSATTLSIDTTHDITIDSLWSNQNDFEIMFIVEVSDSASVNKVHIDLGTEINTLNLLNTSYDFSSNTGDTDLIYEPYSNFINIKLGEFSVDSLLHYSVKLENGQGEFSSPFIGTINH